VKPVVAADAECLRQLFREYETTRKSEARTLLEKACALLAAEQHTYPAIAQVLAVPPGNVGIWVRRGRRLVVESGNEGAERRAPALTDEELSSLKALESEIYSGVAGIAKEGASLPRAVVVGLKSSLPQQSAVSLSEA
jgi:hypothetical protein